MFTWQLLRDRLPGAGRLAAMTPSVPGQVKNWLTLPSTQRWIILALVMLALVWPFFGSRAAVDIATLILIYVMLGIGLNIVVGLAGLLDLATSVSTPWAPTPMPCLPSTPASASGWRCPSPA